MPESTTQITDQKLLEELKNSFIEDEQKTELESLIPEMSDEEKEQLITLISQSKDEQAKYQEGLKNLNEDYTKKMENLVKEESANARAEYEKVEQTEAQEEIKEFETEIEELPEKAETAKQTTSNPPAKTGHSIKLIIIGFLVLVIIAIGATLAIMQL